MFKPRRAIPPSWFRRFNDYYSERNQDLDPVENLYEINFYGINITQKRICYGLSIATVALVACFSLIQFLQYMKFSISLSHSWMYPLCIMLGWIVIVNCYIAYQLFKINKADGYSKLEEPVDLTREPNSMELQHLDKSSTRVKCPSVHDLNILEAHRTTITHEPSAYMNGPSSKRKEPIKVKAVVEFSKKALASLV